MVVRKAGATEWLNSSSGGSGVFTVVASSGGDYETVSAALAAGASDIYIQTDITETADGTFSDDTRIWLAPQITWGLEGNTFSCAASVYVEIIGAPGARLTYRRTTSTQPFAGLSTSKYTFRDLTWINSSVAVSGSFVVAGNISQEYHNVEFTPSSANSAGIFTTSGDCIIDGMTVNSLEDAASVIFLQGDSLVSDVFIVGSVNNGRVLYFDNQISISNISIIPVNAGTSSRYIELISDGPINNISIEGVMKVRVGSRTSVSNVIGVGVTLEIVNNIANFSNCRVFDVNGFNVTESNFSNCEFDSITIDIDRSTYSTCKFANLTVDADYVTIIGCTASSTINLNSGIQNPILVGNKTNLAIVDNGSISPEIVANQVY